MDKKEELLKKDEKKAFEKYINFMMQNGFKKKDFKFTKMPNPGIAEYPFFLRVRIRDYVKIFDIGYDSLKGMVLGQTYTWKELGLYASKSILSDKEKEYLSAVIKPLRDKVENITKYEYDDAYEDIVIDFVHEGCLVFPFFEKGSMYAGMEKYKKYTLKELGI